MKPSSQPTVSPMKLSLRDRLRIGEQAALRLIRMRETRSKDAHVDFLAWCRLSAHHVHEMLFVQAVSRQLDGMDPQREIDVEALPTPPELTSGLPDETWMAGAGSTTGAGAMTRAGEPQAPFHPAALNDRGMALRRRGGLWAGGLIAASVLLALVWIFRGPAWNAERSYATAVGEQRSIKLGDGSVVVLNTGSRVRVLLSKTRREIRLMDGEALFTVRSDPARPFQVSTDTGTVVALGTQFNVYRRGETTRVSVIEGAVRISAHDANHSSTVPASSGRSTQVRQASGESTSLRLNAGDEAVIGRGRVVKAKEADVQRTVAWRVRQLMFRDSALTEVAAEFNRYNRTQIRVEGPALRTRSISGVFEADDIQPLIDFLTSDPQLEIVRGEDEILVRPRMRPPS